LASVAFVLGRLFDFWIDNRLTRNLAKTTPRGISAILLSFELFFLVLIAVPISKSFGVILWITTLVFIWPLLLALGNQLQKYGRDMQSFDNRV